VELREVKAVGFLHAGCKMQDTRCRMQEGKWGIVRVAVNLKSGERSLSWTYACYDYTENCLTPEFAAFRV
jgi:hypothetical protein